MRRRDYLKLAGGTAIGGALATGTVAGYDRVIDVVADLGVDNNGDSAIDDDLEPYLEDGTVLEFPDGQYRIDQLVLWGLSNFGMRATGDASLVPGDYPEDDVWIGGGGVRDLRFEGFLVDTTDDVAPTIGFSGYDGLVIKDIEKVGAHAGTGPAFSVTLWDEDGSGLIENVDLSDGDEYPDSVGATGFYTKTDGTLTFRNCTIEGWGDNGLYASDASGPVQVEGGYFANNNISQVRLGSSGSYVREATIEVDKDRGGEPNMRGVRVCSGPGPVDVVDCDISMERGQGSGGVVVAYDGGSVNVLDSRIHVGEDYTTVGSGGTRTSFGVLVDDPTGVDYDTAQLVQNTSITGGGTRGGGILFRRGNTVVRNACIEQTGTSRDGVIYQTSAGNNVVEDSTIDVSAETVVKNEASVSVSNITESGSCPLPSGMGSSEPSGSLSLPSTPLPAGAQNVDRPTFGTTFDNPTAVIYGSYEDPAMAKFLGDNFAGLIEDFVQTGRLNLQLRILPEASNEAFLTQLGLGVWDKEPENFRDFLEYVFANQSSIEYDSVDDARSLLQNAGVRNYGWIPWLAYTDEYAGIIDENENRAGVYGLSDWPDFPPLLYLGGDVAAPQYSYDGIASWIERRI